MANDSTMLTNGDELITARDRINTVLNLKDLHSYRIMDDGSEVVKGTGKVVAKEDDLIWSFELNRMFRCSRTDYTTFVNDLTTWNYNNGGGATVVDPFLGVSGGANSHPWRAFLDTRVFPHRLAICSRYRTFAQEAASIRLFRGINTTDTGEVISAFYNQNSEYVGDKIPLVLVATNDVNNRTTKAPAMGYTTKSNLKNGDLITLVEYNDQNAVVDTCQLTIHVTNAMRLPEYNDKRIQGIELISPYLSKTEPNVLEVPINSTVATLMLKARVTFTDGSVRESEGIGGESSEGRFKLIGIDYWSPRVAGDAQELMLIYHPSDDEYSYLQGETANGTVFEPYRIKAMPVPNAYNLKVFAYPTWLNDLQGYGLEFWLYDMNREIGRKLPTGAVTLADGYLFDGLDYTRVQHLQVGVKLSVVDPAYGEHVHVQNVMVNLIRPGGARNGNWKVKFATNQAEYYGDTLEALVSSGLGGVSTIDLRNGQATEDDWLNLIFYRTSPLYDTQTETKAPRPTHFVLTTRNRSVEVPMAQWASAISFVNDLSEGQTVYLKFVRKLADTTLQLGVAGIPIHNV